jgi:DedD protein
MTQEGNEPKPGDGGGALLSRHRARAGWTVEQLATALKISPAKLRALESDRYEELGEPVFFRGYAATACRILGTDPRPVLERLPAAKPGLFPRAVPQMVTSPAPRPKHALNAAPAAVEEPPLAPPALAASVVVSPPLPLPLAPPQLVPPAPPVAPPPPPTVPPAPPVAPLPPPLTPSQREASRTAELEAPIASTPVPVPPEVPIPTLEEAGDSSWAPLPGPARTPTAAAPEPPILIDPPITLDPAHADAFTPDLPNDWHAPARSTGQAAPPTSRGRPYPSSQDLPSGAPAPVASRPVLTQAFSALRSVLQGRPANGSQDSPRGHRHGTSRRWITATVTVTVAALAVVGIGRPFLDQGRPVETAPDPVAQLTPAETPAVPAATTALASETSATISGSVEGSAATPDPRPAALKGDIAAGPAQVSAPTPAQAQTPTQTPPPTQAPAKRVPRAEGAATRAIAATSRNAVSAEAQPATRRYIVQLATYRNLAQAREVRRKVESLGLRAYYQTLNTSEGRRFRVRVGPFATRAEAERAQKRVASLRFSGKVLFL